MMESVRRAKARLRQYPAHLAACSAEGAVYAACVTKQMSGVSKDECKAEFEAFKTCVKEAAKRAGTKL